MYAVPMTTRTRVSKVKRPDWAEAVAKRRRELGLRQEDIAARTREMITQGTVSDVERGRVKPTNMTTERFNAYLDALSWSAPEFSEKTGLKVSNTPSLYPDKPNIYTDQVALVNPDLRLGSKIIPEYNMVGMGPGGQDGDILGYIDIPDSWSGEHVGYRAVGESMSPTIKDGDTVVVKVQNYASPKNIIVCWLPSEGMICKYLQEKTDDGVYMLTSHNPANPPIWTKELTIYGIVREIRQRIEIINGNH